ncbi:hypothetical protein [Rhodopirellula europaea]
MPLVSMNIQQTKLHVTISDATPRTPPNLRGLSSLPAAPENEFEEAA